MICVLLHLCRLHTWLKCETWKQCSSINCPHCSAGQGWTCPRNKSWPPPHCQPPHSLFPQIPLKPPDRGGDVQAGPPPRRLGFRGWDVYTAAALSTWLDAIGSPTCLKPKTWDWGQAFCRCLLCLAAEERGRGPQEHPGQSALVFPRLYE